MKETELQVKIARLATSVASALYLRVTNKSSTNKVDASAHLVKRVFSWI